MMVKGNGMTEHKERLPLSVIDNRIYLSDKMVYDLIIIGGEPEVTLAERAGQAGLSVLLLRNTPWACLSQ